MSVSARARAFCEIKDNGIKGDWTIPHLKLHTIVGNLSLHQVDKQNPLEFPLKKKILINNKTDNNNKKKMYSYS